MEIDEIQQLYDDLMELIRRLGLTWVADQVSEAISVGKVVETDLRTLRNNLIGKDGFTDFDEPEFLRSGPREDVLSTEEYTPEDRLRLLLDAIEESVVVTGSMEIQLIEGLITQGINVQGIEFYSEITDEVTMTIDRSRIQPLHETVTSLKELLDQVRQEI